MLMATTTFAEALGSWASAIEASDTERAKSIAMRITKDGHRLAAHPGFARCIEKHFFGMNSIQLLESLGQFLDCATEARVQALKENR